MSRVTLIWAQDKNGVIGNKGQIPWRIPEDLTFFKEQTMGGAVIMGRKTWESIPEKFRPLPGRVNIVMTHAMGYHAPGALVVHNTGRAMDVAKHNPDIFIVGGEVVYNQFSWYASYAIVTEVDHVVEGDTFAPLMTEETGSATRRPTGAKAKEQVSSSVTSSTNARALNEATTQIIVQRVYYEVYFHRSQSTIQQPSTGVMTMHVTKRSGELQPMDQQKYERQIDWACEELAGVSAEKLKSVIKLSFYDGITTAELNKAVIIAAAGLISVEEPNWTYVAARMVMQEARKQVTGGGVEYPSLATTTWLRTCWPARWIPSCLIEDRCSTTSRPARRDRPHARPDVRLPGRADRRGPVPESEPADQEAHRAAPALAYASGNGHRTRRDSRREKRTERALEYYHTYGLGLASPSTPTQFNAGTLMPQLSSCFGTMIPDSTDGIMQAMHTTAKFSKSAGGVSSSFTHLRAANSLIESTKGRASGPIPYAKLLMDVTNAFDQGGKRKGAGVGYLAPWHADFESWLKLHDPGDERQRAHDMFVASWIPDVFMERVAKHEMWSMFDPKDVPKLLETHGAVFTQWYEEYERQGLAKKQVDAEALWRELITKWVQQSVGWPCFSDEINHRYAQPEMIHQSNLCTEICLRNDEDTSFVCNLTSVNLSKFDFRFNRVTKRIDWNEKLEKVVRTCVRSLDSVISVGFTPHDSGRKFQLSDRAIGLGVMGGVEALYRHGIAYESDDAVHFSNEADEADLGDRHPRESPAVHRTRHLPQLPPVQVGEGKLPIDTVRRTRVIEKFGLHLDLVDCPFAPEGWDTLRSLVKKGMRNSTLMAIAPTATIALILNTTECFQPPEDLLVVKENMSSDFKVISPIVTHNPYGLEVKNAFDIDHMWTVWAASARQLWIDQAQSTNIWVNPNNYTPKRGCEKWADYLDELLFEGWRCGQKTFYYLHSTSMALTPTSVGVKQPGPAVEYDPETDPDFTGGGGHRCVLRSCHRCRSRLRELPVRPRRDALRAPSDSVGRLDLMIRNTII
jgi:ribonucleoside-diphosphate reductase alpha chain